MGVRNASAVLVLLAAASSAQQEILTWTDGVLGSKVTYSMQGDPFELWGLGVSTNGGPTPIALIDPSDPRKLSIGIELFPQIWAFGQFPANGLASYYYDLSANPSAVGVALHAQFMTVPGATTIVTGVERPPLTLTRRVVWLCAAATSIAVNATVNSLVING